MRGNPTGDLMTGGSVPLSTRPYRAEHKRGVGSRWFTQRTGVSGRSCFSELQGSEGSPATPPQGGGSSLGRTPGGTGGWRRRTDWRFLGEQRDSVLQFSIL